MAKSEFNTGVSGLPFVISKLKAIRAGVVGFLGKKRIEKYLVAKMKARFEPRGSNPVAQRSPDGRMWPFAAQATIERRAVNKDRSHALYVTGKMQRAIVVTKKGPGLLIGVLGKGQFRIGIKANSPVAKYGLVLNSGGVTPRGGIIPARPFLGVGKAEAEELAIIGKGIIEGTMRR